MSAALAIALIALGAVLLLVLVVGVVAARSLIVGGKPVPIAYKVNGDRVELAATELTRAPGVYGLIVGDAHAQIGDVAQDGETSLERELGTVTGGTLPIAGEGRWVRDVYPTPAALGLPFTEVSIATGVGTAPAWVIPGRPDGDVWAIHLHGIRTTRSVVLPGVAALVPTGVTSLVPSWRGDSEGPSTPGGGSSLGEREWLDVDAALAFAVDSGAKSVVLVGWSMGALIASLLLERSRLADRIAAVVMVAPVTSWRAVLKNAVRAAHMPAAVRSLVEAIVSVPVLCRLAGLDAPIRISRLASTRVTVPTLVLHNAGDPLAPFSATVDFCEKNDDHAELVVFEDAPHAMEWNRESKRFEETVTSWVASTVARERA